MNSFPSRWLFLLGTLLLPLGAGGQEPPALDVRDVTIPAGETFQVPITGTETNGSPLAFAVVSVVPTNLTARLTSGNRSLLLAVTGKDANTNDFAGNLVLELFEDLAPRTTARIITLVQTNFYNGLTFHRIVDDFVVQGGDPKGDGTGGSGVTFDDEYSTNVLFNGFGQLGMANAGKDSNDSQFFITDIDLSLATNSPAPPRFLTFRYPIFGQLTSGFDVYDKLVHTPLAGSTPVYPVTIVTASLFTNRQDAVLRLYAPTNFTGTATVTVSATATNGLAAAKSFLVTVITNTVNNPAFFGPLPDSLIVTQNTSVTLPFTVYDLEGDDTELQIYDAFNPPSFPANLDVILGTNGTELVLTPYFDFTGTIPMLLGIRDSAAHDYDTQYIPITVVPPSTNLTVILTLTKGEMIDSALPDSDKIRVSGTAVFAADSPDKTYDPRTEWVQFQIGPAANPFLLTVPPGHFMWKGRDGSYLWHSPWGTKPAYQIKWNAVKGKFLFYAFYFDMPAPPQTNMIARLTAGPDHGSTSNTWIAISPIKYQLPKPPKPPKRPKH